MQVLRAQDVPQGGLRQQPDWLKVDNLATLLGESEGLVLPINKVQAHLVEW